MTLQAVLMNLRQFHILYNCSLTIDNYARCLCNNNNKVISYSTSVRHLLAFTFTCIKRNVFNFDRSRKDTKENSTYNIRKLKDLLTAIYSRPKAFDKSFVRFVCREHRNELWNSEEKWQTNRSMKHLKTQNSHENDELHYSGWHENS